MPGVKVQVQVQVQVARCKIFFKICHRFLISNLKILPIWFSQFSKCHLKDFHSRISKQGLLFGICDFSIFTIWSDVVNLWVGHPVFQSLSNLYCFCFQKKIPDMKLSNKQTQKINKYKTNMRRFNVWPSKRTRLIKINLWHN